MNIANAIGQDIQRLIQQVDSALHPRGATTASQTDGGWDASVGGSQPNRVFDSAMLDLATAAYDPSVTHVGGWTRVGDGELAQAGIDEGLQYRNGMLAGVYTDGDGHYVVAFAGNDGNDVPTVVAQSLGLDTHQYAQAADLARQVENAYGGDNVIFTGHSMGGGLAGTAAAATGSTSIVFNSQGVHDNTLARLGLDPAATRAAMADRSRAYGLDGDYATAIQNDIPLANALPDALGADLRIANPTGDTSIGGNNHYPSTIKAAFDSNMPIRSGNSEPQPFEQPAEAIFNAITSLLRAIPIRI